MAAACGSNRRGADVATLAGVTVTTEVNQNRAAQLILGRFSATSSRVLCSLCSRLADLDPQEVQIDRHLAIPGQTANKTLFRHQ